MATTSTSLTVTIVTNIPDPGDEDLLLEAEIVDTDNAGVTTYLVGSSYILRLYKSTNLTVSFPGTNIGTCAFSAGGLTAQVPTEGDDPEYITFTGSNSGSLSKVFESNLIATPLGSVYNSEGAVIGAPNLIASQGSKDVVTSNNTEIYGVYEVSYVTKYDTYTFNSPLVGPMLIFFIGTSV